MRLIEYLFDMYQLQLFFAISYLKPTAENLKFNLGLFRKRSLKIAFDALYGLPKEGLIHRAPYNMVIVCIY